MQQMTCRHTQLQDLPHGYSSVFGNPRLTFRKIEAVTIYIYSAYITRYTRLIFSKAHIQYIFGAFSADERRLNS